MFSPIPMNDHPETNDKQESYNELVAKFHDEIIESLANKGFYVFQYANSPKDLFDDRIISSKDIDDFAGERMDIFKMLADEYCTEEAAAMIDYLEVE